jgi:TetR/AcrR family transcriptional repressor of mexJK operon
MVSKKYSTRGVLILSAAQKLFLCHGYDETSLEMIICESGGSRRSIYSEFGNKEGLLLAVIKSQVTTQTKTLKNIDYNLQPEQALTAICESFIEGMISPEMIALFRLISYLTPKIPDVGMLVYEKGLLTGHQPIVDYFEYLQEQNILTIDDKEFAARSLINMVKTSLHMKAVLAPSIVITKKEISTQAKKSVRFLLNAYR